MTNGKLETALPVISTRLLAARASHHGGSLLNLGRWQLFFQWKCHPLPPYIDYSPMIFFDSCKSSAVAKHSSDCLRDSNVGHLCMTAKCSSLHRRGARHCQKMLRQGSGTH
ncbi:hypothetical protein CEXT_797931 [Caerostris extrusa]|uniref:Uncharacterized protein n=1 Tax=Caerostris extrusa TaxID=172846 RepID=A0AAV4TY28_CAEEX|nr:hypothetical protein CEXT_797931 [Caerostris extrusa]